MRRKKLYVGRKVKRRRDVWVLWGLIVGLVFLCFRFSVKYDRLLEEYQKLENSYTTLENEKLEEIRTVTIE